jgi:hypothetical protein
MGRDNDFGMGEQGMALGERFGVSDIQDDTGEAAFSVEGLEEVT